MEDLIDITNNLIGKFEDIKKDWDADVKDLFENIDKIVNSFETTPQKQKKKIKRLSVIVDTESEDSLTLDKDASCTKETSQHQEGEPVPRPAPKTQSKVEIEDSRTSKRPVRAAKLKVENSLKEPNLSKKLRRPSNTETNIRDVRVHIKKEKIFNESQEIKNKDDKVMKINSTTTANEATKRKSSDKDDENIDKERPKKVKMHDSDSLIFVESSDEQPVVLLEISGDESEKMLPPATIPKRTRNATGKNKSQVTNLNGIKKEKESLTNNKTKTISNNDSELSSSKTLNEKMKKEKNSDVAEQSTSICSDNITTTTTTRTTRTKGKRTKKAKHKPIKEEKLSIAAVNNENEEDNSDATNKTKEKRETRQNTNKKKQGSIESVYEDAISENLNKESSLSSENTKNIDGNTKEKSKSKAKEISPKINQEISENKQEKPADATFMSAVDVPVSSMNLIDPQSTFVMEKHSQNHGNDCSSEKAPAATTTTTTTATGKQKANEIPVSNDQTFVTNPAQTTFVLSKNDNEDATENPKLTSDETFNVQPSSQDEQKDMGIEDIASNSILTEDESFADEYIPKAKPKPNPKPMLRGKTTKELFNPLVQSPVKKKVEAFEKHANSVNASPSSQRQTRLKTRAPAKENKNQSVETHHTVKYTPTLMRKFLTPTQQQNITAAINNSAPNKKQTPLSNSKIPHPKAGTFTTAKSASTSREPSVEDTKRAFNKIQQIEEQKKKRAQKQQTASQIREANEKERVNKLLKAQEEKEEKLRRKVLEAEQKRQLEEINRNIKLQEEKQQIALQIREANEKERVNKLLKAQEEKEEKLRRKALEAEQKRQLEEINRNIKLQEEKLANQKLLEKQKQMQAETSAKQNPDFNEMKMKGKEKFMHEKRLLDQKKLLQAKKDKCNYNFDMLNSDDSTDDEGKVSGKRPAPPAWSKSSIRKMYIEKYAHISSHVIDRFFSVEPMTPDLQQIFPNIEPKYLKRNSSIYWRTPPRYSQLPKY